MPIYKIKQLRSLPHWCYATVEAENETEAIKLAEDDDFEWDSYEIYEDCHRYDEPMGEIEAEEKK